ncbi:hypothetical protein EJ03DRAFT_347916 [Teratosphaeria nubilosa]|uniref:Uncharacterized protein n=1 Tax=Teratosphaeria nubilosa TaxID=161662 RepID=A0A6G1LKI0_9PEZI|nr:hypothetical protein EJ03DRAFT_347916 [Teratosphaeria nubilosa]
MADSKRTSIASGETGYTQTSTSSQQQSWSNATNTKAPRSINGLSVNGKRMIRPPKNPRPQQSTAASSPADQQNGDGEREIQVKYPHLFSSANPHLWREIMGTDLPTSIDTEGVMTVTAEPKSYSLPHREDLDEWMRGGSDLPPLGSIINDPVLPDNDPPKTEDDDDEDESSEEEDYDEGSDEDDTESRDEEDVDEALAEPPVVDDNDSSDDEDEDDESEPSRTPNTAPDNGKRKREESPEDDSVIESSQPEPKKARTVGTKSTGPISLRRLAEMRAAGQAQGAEPSPPAPRGTNVGQGSIREGVSGRGGRGGGMVGRDGGRGDSGVRDAPPASQTASCTDASAVAGLSTSTPGEGSAELNQSSENESEAE